MEFLLLGPMEVRVNGEPLALGGPRQRAVLAALLLAPDRVVSIDSLIQQVWDGCPPSTARTQVAICVAGLRKLFRSAGIEQELIVTAAPGYSLATGSHRLDTLEFAKKVELATALSQDGKATEAADALRDALALWRGPALGGISAQFAEVEATRLAEHRMLAVEQLLGLRLEIGEHRTLIGELAALVQTNPLRDHLRGLLMLAQYRSGRRAEALETFREGQRHSIEELGLELGTELQELHDSILRDESEGLVAPGAASPPAPEAATGFWVAPAQLPAGVPGFTGRKEELRALDGVLAQRSANRPAPVCFVTGSPGIGKTGLAVHWANRVAAQFPDGQMFIDLREPGELHEPLSSTEALHRFLRGMGVHPDRIPDSPEECAALYRSLLDGRQVLIILDNATSFSQVRPLLPGNGRFFVLVTGRDQIHELMDSCGAVRVRLGELAPEQSTQLLSKVVGDERVEESPEAAAEVGDLCGHTPLALRAAGARLASKPHWTVDTLVGRLVDEGRRLDELSHGENAVRRRFDLSYRRLDPEAAVAYHELSSIEDPDFDLGTGAEVLETPEPDAEDVVERLVDAQLLEVSRRDENGDLRYRFQELVRLHAKERPTRGMGGARRRRR